MLSIWNLQQNSMKLWPRKSLMPNAQWISGPMGWINLALFRWGKWSIKVEALWPCMNNSIISSSKKVSKDSMNLIKLVCSTFLSLQPWESGLLTTWKSMEFLGLVNLWKRILSKLLLKWKLEREKQTNGTLEVFHSPTCFV